MHSVCLPHPNHTPPAAPMSSSSSSASLVDYLVMDLLDLRLVEALVVFLVA